MQRPHPAQRQRFSILSQYLSSYISTVHPDMLCFDHYPLFSGVTPDSDVSTAGYHRNLRAVASAARSASLPFFNFFGSMPYNGRADVSEAQLRWQAFTSLAYGAKGVLYFCYWSPTGTSFEWGGGLITPRSLPSSGVVVYEPGPKYDQVRCSGCQAYTAKARTYALSFAGGPH